MDDDGYILTVLRCTHQNPVKAGLLRKVGQFPWSSYKEYVNESEIVDKDFVLEMFSSDRKSAVEQFKKYMNEPSEDKCPEDEEKIQLTDNEVRACLSELGIASISDLQQKEKGKRDEIIRAVKSMKGTSIRQLSRIARISKSVIDRT